MGFLILTWMEMKMGGACSVTVDNGNWVHQHLSITFMVSHQHLQCYTDIYSITPTFTVLQRHLQCYTNIYNITPTFTVLHWHLQCYTNFYSATPTFTVLHQHLQYAKWRRMLWGWVRGTSQGCKQDHQRVAAWLEGKETIKREKQKI